ncbi:MAG: histidinol-phosphate transaminase [Eubacterium sp.]|nr:histidinol-phosphate transaminase [Eubacterium sp.]
MFNWESNVRRVDPYVPGEQPKEDNIIKLNTNENPYPPSPNVKMDDVDISLFRKYPDPTAGMLVKTIAEYHGVNEDQVFVGVGSDDVLAMSFMTFFNSEKPILFPDITYSFYPVWAEEFRIPYKAVPLNDDFRIVKEDYYTENGGIVFPNPNAPTGIEESLSFVRDILDHNRDSVVIVDEAYIDFGGESALSLIPEYDNLLVTRTFSKSRSMAGLRIGYAIGNAEMIKFLSDVKYSFNSYTMNMPSIILGVKSIEDDKYFRETVEKIKATREWFTEELRKRDFHVLPSSSNFVFAEHKELSGRGIFEAAKKKGIYMRHFNAPRIQNFLRITIGTDEEMRSVIEFLDEFFKISA